MAPAHSASPSDRPAGLCAFDRGRSPRTTSLPSVAMKRRPYSRSTTLQPLLSPRTIMASEIVLEFDEPPHNWWLLSRGRAGGVSQPMSAVLSGRIPAHCFAGVFVDGVRVMTLSDGAYFGDAALLWGVKSPYSIVTDTPCSFYVLSRFVLRLRSGVHTTPPGCAICCALMQAGLRGRARTVP